MARIPQPYQQPDVEQVNGRIVAVAHDARRVAQDYCNASNTSLDQDLTIPPQNVFGWGNNLSKQGVFWIEKEKCKFDSKEDEEKNLNPHPPEEVIAKAEARREQYFRTLIDEARAVEISAPQELANTIMQDHHMAAEYFGEEYSWHKRRVQAVQCPNCGEQKPKGRLFHKGEFGFCVEQSQAAWKAAVNSGVKTKADVPDDFKW